MTFGHYSDTNIATLLPIAISTIRKPLSPSHVHFHEGKQQTMNLEDKKVLITGGSAGIGKSIIKELVERGVQDIAVVGRRKETLDAL